MKAISLIGTILCSFIPSLHASVDTIFVGSLASYQQSESGQCIATALDGEGPYEMVAGVDESGDTSVSSLSLRYPGGTTLSGANYAGMWMCRQNYNTKALMLNAAPAGNYVVTVGKKSGGSVRITFAYDNYMAASALDIPGLRDYEDYIVVDHHMDTVSWGKLRMRTLNCPNGADMAGVVLKMTDTGGTNYMRYEGKVEPGRCSFDGIEIPETITSTHGKKFYLDIQFMAYFSAKNSTSFSGAVETIAATTVTRIPFYTPIYLDKMSSFFSTRAERDWVIDLSDGEVQSEHAIAPYVCVDVVTDLPTNYLADPNKVTLRLKSPGLNPVKASSVGPISKGVARCVFRNIAQDEGFAYTFVFYDQDGSGCVYENANYLPMSQPSRDEFISAKLTLSNGIVQRIAAQLFNKDGYAPFPADHMDLVLRFRDGSPSVSVVNMSRYGNEFYFDLTSSDLKIDLRSLESIEFHSTYDSVTDNHERWELFRIDFNDFSGTPHTDGWASPDGTVPDSFLGWFHDGFYPYVYSASADMLKNGTYKGDGSGWIYFSHAPNGDSGYYIYRFATGSWAYTRADWHGWIYDYASGWLDLTPAN